MSAVPAAADEELPTRSGIENWPTQHLDDAADRWDAKATTSVATFEQHHRNVVSPGGTEWTGLANEAAVNRVTGDLGVVRHHAEVKTEAAKQARTGAEDIRAVKKLVAEALSEAEQDGFTVADDLSVTDARKYDIDTVLERNKAAKEHAEFIRFRAAQLVAADKLVGKQLTAKAAELQGIKFHGEGDEHGAHVQLVDNKTTAAGDGKGKPGEKPGEKPSGADDPNGLAALMLPPEKPDGAAQPKPADKPNAMDLIEAAREHQKDTATHPKSVQDMLLPAGPPSAAGPGAPPKFDPNTPEGKAGLAAARQVLLNDPTVPRAEVDQRLAAMAANAQKPLPLQPPTGQEPGPKPPLPGWGQRLGDGFNDFTNNMHEGFYAQGRETLDGIENLTGTGGPGHPGVADSWKQLAQGTVDDVRNDPLRWNAAQREAQEMVDNPGRYAGKMLFDGTAAAATAPLGGEGTVARGALDETVERGLQHEVTHGPVGRDPVPDAPSPPVDVPHSGDHGLIGHGGDAAPPASTDHSPSTGHLPETGDPGSFGYDGDGNRLPYANHRPDYGPTQVPDVWNQSHDAQLGQIDRGELNLPRPGPDQQWVQLHPNGPTGDDWTVQDGHRLIEWQPGDPRKGLWDMGHVEGREYATLRERYLHGDITFEEFIQQYRDPENYGVQDPYRNRSHIDERP